mgnify:CR=1 FL=1
MERRQETGNTAVDNSRGQVEYVMSGLDVKEDLETDKSEIEWID